MFNHLIIWSLHNRLLVLAITIILFIMGTFALRQMPIDVFPEFAPPQVVIQTEAPGMSPQDVETLITYPLESSINGTPGVTHVRSKTSVGLSTIVIVFDEKSNIYLDRQLVNERVQQVIGRLPPGSKPPVTLPVTSAVGWTIKYALTSDTVSAEELRTISDWEIRPRILALGGIASVVSIGGDVKQYQVQLDINRMLAYHISVEEVRQALEKANTNVPGAFIQKTAQELIVGAVGRVTSLDDIKQTIITIRNGVPITISNVANVGFGAEIKRGDAAYGVKRAVIGTISKAYGADTLTVTYKIEKTLAEIKSTLPSGVNMDMQVFRQANFIETAIHNLNIALLQGALIVIVVLFLFLMNWRASFITFLSMPASFVGGILVMHLLGIGINSMTLGGLAIAIGEVVDNGIIAVENVVRRLRLNRNSVKPLPSIEIVFDAIQEIVNSVVYATVIICLVFVPIFLLSGIAGRIFAPLGIAYIASVLASLVVAVTLVPALCYFMLVNKLEKKSDEDIKLHPIRSTELLKSTTIPSDHAEDETRFVIWLKKHFLKILTWALSHFWVVMGIAGTGILVALITLSFFGRSFLPEFHEGNFIIALSTLPGTSLDESIRLGNHLRSVMMKYPQVISISQRAGRSDLDEDAMPPNFSEFDVRLDFDKDKDKTKSPDEVLQSIRQDLSQIPGAVFNIGQFISHRMDEVLSGVRAQIAIKIFGDNLSTLNQLGQSVTGLLKNIPGAVDINKEQQINVPQVTIKINREMAARYGIKVGDITDDLGMFLNGENISSILEGRRTFDLTVRLKETNRNNLATIQNMLVDAHNLNSEGDSKIPLRSVATVSIEDLPYSIGRENVQRLIVVSLNVQGRDLGSVINDIKLSVQKNIKLPTGYYIEYGGQFESQQEANNILLNFGIIMLFVTLMLLYKVFGTFREAFIVLFNLPLALIGGVIALYLAGATLSVAAVIGFITLFGIAARNGIILVTHYNQLRKEGKPLEDVVVQGTLDRLVPVLMTAATAALGLIPLLLGSPVGKELERPLAQVVLGGLFTSTFLNMIVVPTVYNYIEKRRERRQQKITDNLTKEESQ